MSNILKIELDPKRVFGLDILRALAILFVVIEHGNNLLPQKLKSFTNLFIYDGVSVFFVLSGFLIGGILIKSIDKNKINAGLLTNFWIRRWFRTLPNYFLVLIVLCFLHTIFIDNFSPFSVANYFIFSQNLFQPHPAWFFPEAWSLSVEEWFYLVVPVVMLVSIRLFKISHGTGVLATAIMILLLVTAFRYYRYTVLEINSGYELELFFRKQVITRLDSLMFGVIGAYLSFYHFKKWITYKKTLLVAGVLLFLLSKFVLKKAMPFDGVYSTVFSFTVFSLATLMLLPFLSDLKKAKGVIYQSITYISLTSYSMYLLNLSVIQYWIIDSIPWQAFIQNSYLLIIVKYLFYWFLVIVLSILLYKYFEVPMMKLRDHKKMKAPQPFHS